jgi:two-component system, OmpR family, sensor kinase
MRSIERHLMLWILATAALGAALLGAVAYRVILADLNDMLDENLLAVALAVADHGPQRSADAASAAAHIGTDGAEIIVVEWTPQGRLAFTSNAQVPLRFTDRPGLARQRVQGVDWDAYTVARPGSVVQAAQRANDQQHEAAEAAAQLLPPFALVFGAMAALLILALRRGLAPLDRAAADVAARSAISLEPIDTARLPREVTPLVLALNALMQRLSASLSARQRFVADAAHELRTPITALKLQLQLLRGAPDEVARRRAHEELQASVERVQRLVEQLLELSRSEPGAAPGPRSRVSLAALVQSAVGRFSPRAEHLGIDLGARIQADGLVLGDEEALRVLLDNLIGNALRFTPRGGVVDVEVTDADGCAMLRVIDDGPGIAAEEREQVFERFHRARGTLPAHTDETGSGLGLAIVKAVADGHGALVTLHDGHKGRGLEVRVVFPPPGGAA